MDKIFHRIPLINTLKNENRVFENINIMIVLKNYTLICIKSRYEHVNWDNYFFKYNIYKGQGEYNRVKYRKLISNILFKLIFVLN